MHFPPLDCHAHVAPDVTDAQVRTLGGANVFAMTRTLDEFEAATANPQHGLIWGVGVHPGVPTALSQWPEERFAAAARRSILMGEVGLDRRGDKSLQTQIFDGILRTAPPSLISVHSTGRTREVVDAVVRNPHPGIVLHWFTGDRGDVARAVAAGCYFSINAAMADDQMTVIPLDRVLPETDFPAARSRTRAKAPGDIDALERTVARLTGDTREVVRRRWYGNLAALSKRASIYDRLSGSLRESVDAAAN